MRDNSKVTNNGKISTEGEERHVSLDHVFPESQRLLFSNHVTVQHTNEGEFTLSFFEVNQPVIIGNREEVTKRLGELKTVPATCIARVVIAAARMPGLIGALVKNYETYEKDTGKSPASETDKPKGKKHAG